MNRRTGVVVFVVAVVAALVMWRCRAGSSQASDDVVEGTGGSAIPVVSKGGVAGIVRPDPKTLGRGSLAGTVTDEDTKKPIAKARVCANGSSNDLPGEVFRDSSCADSDDQGRYKIENLLPARYVVSASARTYQPAAFQVGEKRNKRSYVKLAANESKASIDIALRPGGVELTGTVLDLTGGAIGHAKVWASAGGWWRQGTATTHTETDEAGKFSLWVKPGEVQVIAAADGYADNNEQVHAPGKVEILLTPESTLSGTVVDGATGSPIEGARVSVGTSDWGWGFGGGEGVFSDAQGKFSTRRLTPGRYTTTARTDHGYGRSEGSTLVGLGQHVSGVTVKLWPAHRIEGKVVVAKTKEPCEDAGVTFNDTAKSHWFGGESRDGGEVVAEAVLPGTYSVQVWCSGYQAKDQYDKVTVADKDVTGLVWEVDEGATVRGKVLAKSGGPIEGATLWASTVGGGARDKGGWGNNTSNRDGTYELTGLKAANYKIEVSSEKGLAPRDGFRVEVASGATVEKDLVLEDGGTIKGTVVDQDGKPVQGVDVQAEATAEGSWMMFGGSSHKSEDDGTFTLDGIRPGDYRVVAQRSWRDELRKPGTNDDAKQGEKTTVRANETSTVRLVVESQTGTIKGTVVDTAGQPVSDAFVSAARETDAAGSKRSSVAETRWSWDERPVLTSTDGTFTVTKLSPGNYTVRAYRKGGGEAVTEHVSVGSTTRLQIKATGSIDGVAKRSDGTPDELTLNVVDLATGFRRREQFYKTDGHFTVKDVPKGHFQLTVEAEGSQKQVDLDLAEGEQRTGVTVELEALLTLTGRVVEYGTQKPVAGIMMMATAAQGGGFTMRWGDDDRDNISDETGHFTIKHAPRGKLSVRGFPKDWNEDGDYSFVGLVKQVDGTGTVDLGDIGIIKKRVKKGDVVGEIGLHFVEQPNETPPDKRKMEVSWIDPKGPSANTELKVGDVITSIDGIDITGGNSAQAWVLMRAAPGTKLALGLSRGASVTVTLAAP